MTDILFMKRALELAALGEGNVSPNPLVGCVIVHKGKIIGEGYHQQYGEAHAEVNSVNAVEDKSLLSDSTVYVTLEPCAHYGKTPPCADLLVKHKVKRVVICNKDPFPAVDGRGLEKLQKAGIETEVGLLQEEGNALNKVFFKSIYKKRPYVILKWAESADGFVAKEDGKPVAISNELSQIFNHKLRASYDAIIVGGNTIINDNPSLTTRKWEGKNPLRVVIMRTINQSPDLHVYNETADTIVFNEEVSKRVRKTSFVKLSFNENLVSNILQYLYERNVRSIIVEGGPRLHSLFYDSNQWDEIIRIKSSKNLSQGLPAFSIPSALKVSREESLKNDLIAYFYN